MAQRSKTRFNLVSQTYMRSDPRMPARTGRQGEKLHAENQTVKEI